MEANEKERETKETNNWKVCVIYIGQDEMFVCINFKTKFSSYKIRSSMVFYYASPNIQFYTVKTVGNRTSNLFTEFVTIDTPLPMFLLWLLRGLSRVYFVGKINTPWVLPDCHML